ncbi:MAG: TIGR04255 family protein, partial [Alphaproteobacteria bacterium]
MKIRTGPLPSYKQPPVDEVACGIRFEPLPQLKVPHIGVLWEKFRQEYPVTQHATPISTDTSLLVDETTGVPLPRVWFISKGDNELVQFQLDRFYYNWRCRAGVYPRYPFVIEKFETAKRRLDELTEELQLGAIKTVECELTYINHIPKGQGWETIEDLPMLMHDFMWQQQKHSFLPTPANLAWQTRFPLPDDNGWLNVKLNQAKRKVDGLPLLIL